MKKKILKIQVGEAYDKDAKKTLPVYKTAWKSDKGNHYVISEAVFVNEVEIKGGKNEEVEA